MDNLNPKQLAALKLLEEGEEYQNYFFSKASGLVWFYPLRNRGYFAAANNPEPQKGREEDLFRIPHWPALDYLERISTEAAMPDNHTYAEELIQIIRDVTRPKDGQKRDNFRTWWYFTKIMANLPTKVISTDDIDLIAHWLDSNFTTTLVASELGQSLLPHLLKSNDERDWHKAVKLVGIVTTLRTIERKYGEKTVEIQIPTMVDSYWLANLFVNNLNALAEKCPQQIIKLLQTRIIQIITPDKEDPYSYIWRPAIEDHAQNVGRDEPRHVLISAMRDILLIYAQQRPEQAKQVIETLLNQRLIIFRRIGLYVINKLYQLHNDLLWDALTTEFFDVNMQHELFELLRDRFSDFSSPQKGRVVEMISNLTKPWREGGNKSLLDAQLRVDWLEAIRSQGDQRADELYKEFLSIAKHTSTHPAFPSYTESRSGEISPCSIEELLAMSIDKIVEYVNSFTESGAWEDPTEWGLSEVLTKAVKHNPGRFENNIEKFLQVNLAYQYSLLRAFEELSNERKSIQWDKVLEFCWRILTPKEFWVLDDTESPIGFRVRRNWITGSICTLIRSGVIDDEWAFDESLLEKAENIILAILDKEPSTAKGRNEAFLTEAINTARGKCIEALLSYCLRQARIYNRRGEDPSHFWDRIQYVFDKQLNLCDRDNFEFSALAGRYLPQLWFLSAEWTQNNFDRIFSVRSHHNWLAATDGYAYVSVIYEEIYRILKQQNHIEKALGTEFKNSYVREKIIQNVATAYLMRWETLDDEGSLFGKILEDWRENDISEIIRYFWSLEDIAPEDERRGRILDFWGWCYRKIKGREEENARILSDLIVLSVFLKTISHIEETWLLQAAPYVEEMYHSSFFLKCLDKLADVNPKEVAQVYLRMLDNVIPSYEAGTIRSIIQKLYVAGMTEQANRICDRYGRKGYYGLVRDIYERHK